MVCHQKQVKARHRVTGLEKVSILSNGQGQEYYINRIACTRKVSGKGKTNQNHCGTHISISNVTTADTINSSQVVEDEVFSVFILKLNFFVRQK
jgi:hypothetical protein